MSFQILGEVGNALGQGFAISAALNFRVQGRLVRIADSGESQQKTGACLAIKALYVPLLTKIQGSIHINAQLSASRTA